MTALLKILFGLGAVGAIGFFSIERDMLPGSRADAQTRLAERADFALDAAGADWATVEMAGQKAVLAGVAPDRASLDAAVAAVSGSAPLDMPLLNGVTAVDASGATIYDGPPLADPFIWIAERQEDVLVLSGHVPSESARDAIAQLAAMRFPGVIISGEMSIARGAPPEDDWLAAASISLQALARLDAGAAEADGARFTVSGRAADEFEADAVRTLMAALPAGVAGAAEVTAPEPEESPETAIAVALEPDPAAPQAPETAANERAADEESPIEDAPADLARLAECRDRLNGVLEGLQISFSSGRAAIGPASSNSLRGLATVLLVCPEFSLEVVGHTDSSGDEARNERLSLERAEAVAQSLRAFGLDDAQLTTRGAGAREPMADNATPAGRARNRRIEFNLSPEGSEE